MKMLYHWLLAVADSGAEDEAVEEVVDLTETMITGLEVNRTMEMKKIEMKIPFQLNLGVRKNGIVVVVVVDMEDEIVGEVITTVETDEMIEGMMIVEVVTVAIDMIGIVIGTEVVIGIMTVVAVEITIKSMIVMTGTEIAIVMDENQDGVTIMKSMKHLLRKVVTIFPSRKLLRKLLKKLVFLLRKYLLWPTLLVTVNLMDLNLLVYLNQLVYLTGRVSQWPLQSLLL